MLALLIALVTAEPAVPRTVNGQVLGTLDEFTTAGPSRVCMDRVMVTALPEESVTLLYSGIHAAQLRLNRGRSWVDLGIGDSWVRTRQVGDVVERRQTAYFADISDDRTLRYGLFEKDEDDGTYRLAVKVDGPGLVGDIRDRSVLRRIELRNDQTPPCDVTYNYGWGVILGDEPLVQKPNRER